MLPNFLDTQGATFGINLRVQAPVPLLLALSQRFRPCLLRRRELLSVPLRAASGCALRRLEVRWLSAAFISNRRFSCLEPPMLGISLASAVTVFLALAPALSTCLEKHRWRLNSTPW